MFFVISGFAVLMSAYNRRPAEFVVSRIVRLYPAYWVAVTITAIVSVTLSLGNFKVSAIQYLANLTMLNTVPRIPNVTSSTGHCGRRYGSTCSSSSSPASVAPGAA